MAQRSTAGTLLSASTGTGQVFVKLPNVPSVTSLFITITGGAATVVIEIQDGAGAFLPVYSATATCALRLAFPATRLAVNVTANAGAVTVTYRSVVVQNVPNVALEVFSGGGLVPTATTVGSSPAGQKRLYGPAAPALTTPATIYTAPAAKSAFISYLHIVNTTGSLANFTMSLGIDAAATRLFSAFVVQANGILSLPMNISLVAAEIIQACQGTSGALTLTLNGSEV